MKAIEILLILIGLVLCLFGALFIVGGIANLISPKDGQSAVVFLIFTLFFGFAPVGAGVFLCIYAWKRGKRRSKQVLERTILRLAQSRNGRLTVADVAKDTALSSDQAKRFLDKFNLDGLAGMHVSDSGSVVYTFDGIGEENG